MVVGVAGGIAAFKAPTLVRELLAAGAEVRVAMTGSAQRFVGAATFGGLLGRPPLTDLWHGGGEPHVAWGAWADAVVVAPATANLLARAAAGMADDPVAAIVCCARGPVLWAPAMHGRMWRRATVQAAVRRLREAGDAFVGPERGPLASGEVDEGRMAEPSAIVAALSALLGPRDLAGRHVLVTAGPTLEDIDPVRFLGNRSSGRMGFAVAGRAAARGARVTLVAGPTTLPTPPGVERVDVRSALQMHDAVVACFEQADAVVMAAAVADYRPARRLEHKLKKGEGPIRLQLERNPDILADLGARRGDASRPVLVGFAVESEELEAAARDKLRRKRVDLVVANHAEVGFGGEQNEALLVTEEATRPTGRLDKRALADLLLDEVVARLADGAS